MLQGMLCLFMMRCRNALHESLSFCIKGAAGSLAKKNGNDVHTMVRCSGFLSIMQHRSAHRGVYTHAIYLWQYRDLCAMASQGPPDSKREAGYDDASKAAWESLTSQMKDLKDGLAKGKNLEVLKGLVDQLEPSADPTDLRLGLACLRLAQSLAAASAEPSDYLCYAQRAMKSLENLEGSREFALCLFVLGSAYVELDDVNSAASHLKQCIYVLRQIKGDNKDYSSFSLSAHHVLGQVESLRGNFHESFVHYEHAIRIGKKAFKAGSPNIPTLYYQAGTVCRNVPDPRIAMCFAEKALEGFMACYGPSSLQVGKVKALMSGIHCDLEKSDDALLDYEEAKPILMYLKETDEMARMNIDIANLLLRQNQDKAALSLLKEVIEITDITSQFHVTALVKAATAYSQSDLEAAAEYYHKAIDALGHQKMSYSAGNNLMRLGILAGKRAEFERAAELLLKALNMFESCSASVPHSDLADDDKTWQRELDEKVWLRRLSGEVGKMLLRAGKAKKAIPFFLKSLKDADGGNELFTAHFRLGTAYIVANQKLEASKHFNACNAMADDWIYIYFTNVYYKFAIGSRSMDIMGAVENMGICMLGICV